MCVCPLPMAGIVATARTERRYKYCGALLQGDRWHMLTSTATMSRYVRDSFDRYACHIGFMGKTGDSHDTTH